MELIQVEPAYQGEKFFGRLEQRTVVLGREVSVPGGWLVVGSSAAAGAAASSGTGVGAAASGSRKAR